MIIRRESKKPRGIVAAIAAVEGFGKSTTMAKLPGAYFLDVDEGSFGLDVPCIEFDGTVAGLLLVLQEIKSGKGPDDLKTLCIDTADKLVSVLAADFCERQKWTSMEEFDYGKCWNIFKPEWEKIWDVLKTDIARGCGIDVFTSVHIDGNKSFTEKTTGKTWNRWSMRMPPKCAATVLEATDLYVTGIYDVLTETKGKERSKLTLAVDETRMIYTEHSSTWDGKCRNYVTMPDGSPMKKKMTLDVFQKNIAGIIAASTDKNAERPKPKPKPAPAPEKPKDEEQKPEPKKAVAKPKPAPVEETVEEQPEAADERPIIAKLRAAIKAYDLTEEAMFNKYNPKHTDRYGEVSSLDEWTDGFVEWLLKGMDKIAKVLKQ